MKLVIDIPDKIYAKILKNKGTDKSLDFDEGLILEVAAENGTPLEEELTKIKAEIKQQGSIHVKYRRTEDIDYLVDSIVYQCKDGFCNYIDNYIKELKGE